MKTRIRKKEYNNGKIEFICEKKYTPELSIAFMFVSILNISIMIKYLISKDWDNFLIVSVLLFLCLFISINSYVKGWTLIYFSQNCTYNSLYEAKKELSEFIKKEFDKKAFKYGKKTKKTTIIKYP